MSSILLIKSKDAKTFAIRIITCFILLSLLTSCAKLRFKDPAPPQIPDLPKYQNLDLALVLGAGGAKGFAHLGILEELHNANIKPDLIIGCSAGSMVGALYADNPNIPRLKQILLPATADEVLDIELANLPFGLASKSQIERFFDKHIQAEQFNELKIPFIAVATELETGKLIALGSGNVVDAIAASAAFPGAYHPVKLYGRYFVDGGVVDPVPVRLAKKLGAKKIIAVNISGNLSKEAPSNLFGIVKRSLEISYLQQSKICAEQANIVINVDLEDIGVFADTYNEFIYEKGKKAAQHKLAEIKQLLSK